jgi:hypothetical protein
MFKSIKIALPALLIMLTASQAAATYQAYWAVDWALNIGQANIGFKLLNLDANTHTAGIAGAIGRESATAAGININGQYSEFAPVFCVDLTQFAADNFSGAFEVDVNTQADGNYGWTAPSGDGDELRSEAGLQRAAELASYYGSTWANVGSVLQGTSAADRNDRAIALNVAIWQAAYGSNFVYMSGLGGNRLTYFNTYIAHYNLGKTHNSYKWWDSKATNGQGQQYSEHQDFISGTVPEPSSLLLLGSVLASGALLPRLRRKKRSA